MGARPALEAAAPQGADAPIQEQPHHDQRSFWQQPFVQNVLPFLTSLVLHIGVIVFGLLMLKVGVNTPEMFPPLAMLAPFFRH